VLKNGELVKYDNLTGQEGKPRNNGPNAKAEAEAERAGALSKEEWGSEENKKARDQFINQYGYDPATGQFGKQQSKSDSERMRSDQSGNGYSSSYPQAGNGYNKYGNPNDPAAPGALGNDYNNPGGATDYGAMDRTMAPGAAAEVQSTVDDMRDTFSGGSDGGDNTDSGAGYGGSDNGDSFGGGDTGGDNSSPDSSQDFGGGGDEE
jgi:hypothetical protein